MATQDLTNDILQAVALNPQTISSDATTAGSGIDTQGYESVTFIMEVGTVTAGDVTMLIEESDDNSNWSAVADEDLLGTEADTLLDTTGTSSRIGYIGCERYVRFSAVTDNSADLTVGAVAVLGHARHKATPAA